MVIQHKPCFNFCFWAKLLVAIPAVPLAGPLAAAAFDNPLLQSLAAAAAMAGVVGLAVFIDRLPALSGKVLPRKE